MSETQAGRPEEEHALFPVVPGQRGSAVTEAGENELHEDHSGPYRMRISRLTVDKLGIKMYDRVSAVLAEIIANAYDSDATEVKVHIPFGKTLAPLSGKPSLQYEITVSDNGHGMTHEEVNCHYLMVGSDRRKRFGKSSSRDKNRPVMGRKGIGKLAPFGICKTVEIISRSDARTDKGYPVSHLILNLDEMLFDSEQNYLPKTGPLEGTYDPVCHGTEIRLRGFLRKRVPDGPNLDSQLCARFGIRRQDWDVEVIDNSESTEAIAGLTQSFRLGELKLDLLEGTKVVFHNERIERADGAAPLLVKGWMAFSKNPYKDDHMVGVRIFAKGKIVAQTRDFGAHAGFTGEYSIRSYLVGELHADWLDEEHDLIRSDRQDILWTSDEGHAFEKWGRDQVKKIAKSGRGPVKKRAWEEFVQTVDLANTLQKLYPDDVHTRRAVEDTARTLVSDKNRLALKDADHAKEILQLALTITPHRELLDKLREVSGEDGPDLESILFLFGKARIAEFHALGQVAHERVKVVERLRDLIDDGTTPEQPLQNLIEKAPWLLAPEWTPLGMNETLKSVRGRFESWFAKRHDRPLRTSTIGDPTRRPDFVLLNGARRSLWIVEIKRVGHRLTDAEFLRAYDYQGKLIEFLNENPIFGAEFPERRLTFIVDRIDGLSRPNQTLLETVDSIDHFSWDALLEQTDRSHRDFLGRIDELRAQPRLEDVTPWKHSFRTAPPGTTPTDLPG